ncbi:EAL domain-containing protein [Shewanella sp. AS1]|uniref:putative bifunctional diguanylate cyclase/phosphodiesterase n=1 Tax=Shewanella sp. AS1 TaxID=2907626 RepID=UPI001F355E17|nr:EAL domain-containing protein [Shewanella sp. AS1]MCE9679903.1 EAL domain-containing protein [Shewanella sp. AS1]
MRISKKLSVFVVGFCLPAILAASYSLHGWFQHRIDELVQTSIQSEVRTVQELVSQDLKQLAVITRIYAAAITNIDIAHRQEFEQTWQEIGFAEQADLFQLREGSAIPIAVAKQASEIDFIHFPSELFGIKQQKTGFLLLHDHGFMASVTPISATDFIALVKPVDKRLLNQFQVGEFPHLIELKPGKVSTQVAAPKLNLSGEFDVPSLLDAKPLHLHISIKQEPFTLLQSHSDLAIYLIWGLSLLMLILGYLWLRASLVRPFKLILKQLKMIDPTAKTYQPLQGYGCNELRVFSDQVNGLLARIYRQKERSKTTLEAIVEAVILTDAWAKVVYLNPQAERLLKLNSVDAVGMPVERVFKQDSSETQALLAMMQEGATEPQVSKVKFSHEGGKIMQRSISNLRDPQEQVIGTVIVLRDITQEERLKHQLRHRANYDPVTGLLNRAAFEERIEEYGHGAQQLILCYLNLEQFKLINDSCGYSAGDTMLKMVAKAIQAVVGEDVLLARLAGDDFGLALKNISMHEVAQQAKRIVDSIGMQVIESQGSHYKVGCSIGIAMAELPKIDVQEMLKDAGSACIAAKQLGSNQIHFYDNKDKALNDQRNSSKWATRIAQAIEHNELLLYAQPIEGINTKGQRKRLEILMRIQEPDGRMLPPAQFIAAAERFKLMIDVDKEIIRKTFLWLSLHEELWDDYCLSINLSGNSLGAEGMVEYITAQLIRFGLPSECICFEVTETSAIQNRNRAIDMLNRLRKLGFSFALDDFGTGFASYGYLRELPVNYVKIDGCFIKTLASNPKDHAIVQSIHHICQVMGIETVAEFVENQAIIDKLNEIGINYAQGYAIGRPQPLDEHIQMPERARLMA